MILSPSGDVLLDKMLVGIELNPGQDKKPEQGKIWYLERKIQFLDEICFWLHELP